MDTDGNLLFGVLALQAQMIDAGQFAEACAGWSARKETSLADWFVQRGWITPDGKTNVERLVARSLRQHGGDARASLAEAADDRIRDTLVRLGDRDIEDALSRPPGSAVTALISTVDYQDDTRGRYLLSRLHAAGGLGQVWLAYDTHLGREVALKELRPERRADAAAATRFFAEARITGQLEHPGIVPVYELLHGSGRDPFYTMRFVRGRTLSEASRAWHAAQAAGQKDPLGQAALLNAFVSVCQAVAFAHARGVIHRDLKGQNIILGDYGETVVLDWGLAKLIDRGDSDPNLRAVCLPQDAAPDATREGQVLGTPAYMAPEQAAGRTELISERTDVYGLGAILYEILTGQPPFTGADTAELLQRVCDEAPPPPRKVCPTAPAALEAVCQRAMARNSQDRFASSLDLAREVQRFLADEPLLSYREGAAARAARWARRHKTLATTAAALVLMTAVGLAIANVFVQQEKTRTERARTRAEQLADEARRHQAAAETQRQQAERNFLLARDAVDRYFTQVSENRLLEEPGLQPLRKELLETALDFYRQLVNQARGKNPQVRTELGRAYGRLAQITSQIDSSPDAQALYLKALAIFDQLVQQAPQDENHLEDLATATSTPRRRKKSSAPIPACPCCAPAKSSRISNAALRSASR